MGSRVKPGMTIEMSFLRTQESPDCGQMNEIPGQARDDMLVSFLRKQESPDCGQMNEIPGQARNDNGARHDN